MRPISPLHQVLGLLGWLLLTFAAAAVGAVGSADASGFYSQLSRPGWAPPGWLFAPVWTALYLMMAVAAWIVWRKHGLKEARIALSLFILQLAFNALWTWLFFVWREGALAFAGILILTALIAVVVASFARFSVLAATLLLPYLAWVTFACALTFATWRRNPTLL